MTTPTIDDTCRQIIQHMDRTWQRLPVSHKFPEPLPLAVTLARYRGRESQESPQYASLSVALLAALEQTNAPLYLAARPGGGKTSALRWTARHLAAKTLAKETHWLPVHLDLGQVGQELRGSSLDEILQSQLQKTRPIDYRPFSESRDRLLVLLDGLDLLWGILTPRTLLDDVHNARQGQFLIAGRQDALVEHQLNDWPESFRLTLGTLDRSQREAWFLEHADRSELDKFYAIVAANPHVETLLENPLLFAMTASACIDAPEQAHFSTTQYPGRTGIFAGFVEYSLLRARLDGRLVRGSHLALEHSFPALEQIVLAAAERGFYDRIPKKKLSELARTTPASQAGAKGASAYQFAWKTCLAAGLLEDAGSSYRFLHQQFAEYLAGCEVARRWGEAGHDFPRAFATRMSQRILDPIHVHALAVLSTEPAHEPLIACGFEMLAEVDPADACELFASSGAPQAAASLASIVESGQHNPLVWLAAIDGLAKLPSQQSIDVLTSILQAHARYPEPLVRAAIAGLEHMYSREARGTLDKLVADSRFPAWMRLAALCAGATLPNAGAFALAAEIVADSEFNDDVRTDAVEWLGTQDHSSAEAILSSIVSLPGLSTALRLNIEAALARILSRRQPHASRQSQLDGSEPASAQASPLASIVRRFQTAAILPTPSPIVEWGADVPGPEYEFPLEAVADSGSSHWQLQHLQLANGMERPSSAQEIDDLIARLIVSPFAMTNSAPQQLLALCRTAGDAWNLVKAHPQCKKLPPTLLASCAHQAGQRWFPVLTVPQRTEAVLPEMPGSIEKPTKKRRNPQNAKAEQEEVMVEYLHQCAAEGLAGSLDRAVEFAAKVHTPWGRSTLQKTVAWKVYRKRIAEAKDRTQEKGRRAARESR